MAVNANKEYSDAPEEPVGLLMPPKAGQELFDGAGKSYKVTKDVRPGQLIEEIYERLGDRSKFEVVAHLDDDAPVSEDNPLTLHLLGDVDLRTVRGVVESHEKDENFGLSDEEAKLNVLKDRLTSGEDLPVKELNKLLRSMLS
jgi:hypothetical protein